MIGADMVVARMEGGKPQASFVLPFTDQRPAWCNCVAAYQWGWQQQGIRHLAAITAPGGI
jgi:hypothetical protein